jgi:hypothetical protein
VAAGFWPFSLSGFLSGELLPSVLAEADPSSAFALTIDAEFGSVSAKKAAKSA